jgi:hypothetical protein
MATDEGATDEGGAGEVGDMTMIDLSIMAWAIVSATTRHRTVQMSWLSNRCLTGSLTDRLTWRSAM